AIALDPRQARYHRILGYNILQRVRFNEAVAVAEETGRLFPGEPIASYELGVLSCRAGRMDDGEHAFDQTLALAPVASAMGWKSCIAAWWHGDLVAMKGWLDRVPATFRLNDRIVVMRYQ